MANLTCPKCQGRLKANPIGHWFAKFRCAHCNAKLQFDQKTNLLGFSASILFAITVMMLFIHGYDRIGPKLIMVVILGWFLLMFLSYWLRDVQEER